jgi:hypothetical protein
MEGATVAKLERAEVFGVTRIDEDNPRILHLEWHNDEPMPMSATPGAVLFHDIKKCSSEFKLFMVTRRSTVNPDEVMKLRLELAQPATDYPGKARFHIGFTNWGARSDNVIRFKINVA